MLGISLDERAPGAPLARHALLESIPPLRIGPRAQLVPQDNIRNTLDRLRARHVLLGPSPDERAPEPRVAQYVLLEGIHLLRV